MDKKLLGQINELVGKYLIPDWKTIFLKYGCALLMKYRCYDKESKGYSELRKLTAEQTIKQDSAQIMVCLKNMVMH